MSSQSNCLSSVIQGHVFHLDDHRDYVWGADEWQIFWDDLLYAEDESKRWFLGTLIASRAIICLDEEFYDIIPTLIADAQCLRVADGHQRIVTIISLLDAICAKANQLQDTTLAAFISNLTTVPRVDGERPKRFIYPRQDQDARNAPKIEACVQWFSGCLAEMNLKTLHAIVYHLLVKTDLIVYHCARNESQQHFLRANVVGEDRGVMFDTK